MSPRFMARKILLIDIPFYQRFVGMRTQRGVRIVPWQNAKFVMGRIQQI